MVKHLQTDLTKRTNGHASLQIRGPAGRPLVQFKCSPLLTLQSLTSTIASAVRPAEVHTTCESTRLVFTLWSPTCSRLLWIVFREHSTMPEAEAKKGRDERREIHGHTCKMGGGNNLFLFSRACHLTRGTTMRCCGTPSDSKPRCLRGGARKGQGGGGGAATAVDTGGNV